MPIFNIEYTTKETVYEFREASIEANTKEEAIEILKEDPYEWDTMDSEYYAYEGSGDQLIIDQIESEADYNISKNCLISDIPYPGLKHHIEQYMLEKNIRIANMRDMYFRTYDRYWEIVANGKYDMKFDNQVKLRRI